MGKPKGGRRGGGGGGNPNMKSKRLSRRKPNETPAAAAADGADDQDESMVVENKQREDLQPQQKHINDVLSVEERCNLIAQLSEQILEDPDSSFFAQRAPESDRRVPSKMTQLLELARVCKISEMRPINPNDFYTASLAMLSTLALFKDIIPTYRIRLPTAAERDEQRVSKETKKLWDYERALMTHYQEYLQLLEKTWETQMGGNVNSATPASRLAVTSMLSLCELLKCAFHFNFRNNIIQIVVKQMNHRHCDQVSEACCEAVEHVFKQDTQGDVTLETARLVAKLFKGDYKGQLRPRILKTFIKIPLRVHVDEAQAAKLAAAANAKKRKRDKDSEMDAIQGELQEGSATIDKMALARHQSDTLQAVVLTYFRILKSNDEGLKRDLLPAALEGLAKFAHLINIDTVNDLLEVLKELLKEVNSLSLEASLNCFRTAFQVLQGPGRELQIDLKEYIAPLYGQLPRLGTEGNCRANTAMMIQCLTSAFLKRREYASVRVAAFLKQILMVSMHAPAATSTSLMAVARQIFQQYPNAHRLLENEEDVITSGEYNPNVEDPELSNPLSTSAWELANLRFHLHSDVAHHASAAAEMKLLKLPAEAPDRLWRDMTHNEDLCYITFQRSSKKHPLAKQVEGGRSQVRFVKPRKIISPGDEAIEKWMQL